MKTRAYTIIAALFLCTMGLLWPAAPASAQVPALLNYQGRVAVGGTNYDGAGQFKFSLMNGSSSNTLWSNGVNAVTSTVVKGLYTVLLGDTALPNMAAIPATVFTNNDVRLRVWFAPQGSSLELMSPDQRIASSAYSLNADQLDGQHGAAFALLSSSPTFTGTLTAAGFVGNGGAVTNVNADRVDGLHGSAFAQLNSSPTFTGTVNANGFAGNGAGMTNVNASELSGLRSSSFAQLSSSPTFTGTVHAAGFSGSGASLTGVNADELDGVHGSGYAQLSSSPTFTGTVHAAGFSGSGASLTGVNADELDGVQGSGYAQLSSSPVFTGTVHAAAFSGNGAGITNVSSDMLDGQHGSYYLSATNMTGTLPDARLSTNVAQLDVAQDFSKNNHFLANVGIGMTNPQKRLEVKAQSTTDGIRVDGGAGVSPAIGLSTNDALHGELALAVASGQYSADAAAGDIILRNSNGRVFVQTGAGSSAIAITTNNYVGIHKSAPTTALDVNGTVTATAFSGGGSELSDLSLNDAKGNTLIVGRDWGDGPLQIFGSTWVVDQQNVGFGWYIWETGDWQSFTAETNGTMVGLLTYVYSYEGNAWTGTLSIYEGEGTTGSVLSIQSVGGDGVNQPRTFTLESPVQVTVSNQYSYYFHRTGGGSLYQRASTNAYAGGRSGYSPDYDYHFYTYIRQTSDVPALVIEPNTLNVGIGVSSPTNKLQVAGHVQCTSVIQTSDRNAKENISPVAPDRILSAVSALPIATWNFKNDSSGQHIGPMAQDFRAAFGFGNTDSGICSVDADGVALAAIQGLNRKLESSLQRKEEEIDALKSRVEQLERMLRETSQQQSP